MLTFLAPKLLWALPLAAAPVLLHLLFLRRAAPRAFSDLTLLRVAYRRAMPSTRLRQWLLLALRTLALAALVLAFARPVLRPAAGPSAAETEGLDAVLLVDSSWSMRAEENGKPRFERALAAAREIMRLLKPSDRVAVAAFSSSLEGELAWSERAAASAALERMRPGWKGTSLRAPLESAYAFLRREKGSGSRRRAILLLTDGARHAEGSLPSGGLARLDGYDPEVALLGLRWAAELGNAAVREVLPVPSPAGGRVELSARLQAYGSEGPDDLDLWVRGRRVQRRTLSVGAAARAESFALEASADGALEGRLELRRDALPPDDAWYFALKVEPRPRILYLHGSPDALAAGRSGWFLRALLSEGGALPFRMDEAEQGRLRQLRLEDYAAVVLDDYREVPAETAEALKRFVLRGGGLWVVAGARAQDFSALDALLPGRLRAAYVPAAAGLRPDAAPSEAPGRGAFRWEDFELERVALGRRWGLEPSAEAEVWMRDGAGAPLLIEGAFGQGRVFLWASAFDLGWTNLALKPAFAALVETALARACGFRGELRWNAALLGEPFVRAWRPGERAPSRVEILAPDGRRSAVIVRERRAVYSDTRTPGLYRLRSLAGDGEEESFAVNLDRSGAEGDLRPGPARWPLLRPEALREDFLLAVYGKEARGAALALVLFLLLADLLLARPPAGGRG